MSVRSSQSITKVFATSRFDTGAATNGDSTPTGTLYVNGTADAASVTVTNITTGLYKAAVTLPTLAIGDVVDLRFAATVNSVSATAVIFTDLCDFVLNSSGQTAIGGTQGTPTFAGVVTGYVNNTGASTFAGAMSLGSTLAVTGATTLTGAVTASNASNNIVGITVGGFGSFSTAANLTFTGGITATGLVNLSNTSNAYAGTLALVTTIGGTGLNAIADQVWDEATSGHQTAGTTGEAISDAQSAGDPWATALPGSYTAGEAGYIVGTNLDGKVSEAGGGVVTITEQDVSLSG